MGINIWHDSNKIYELGQTYPIRAEETNVCDPAGIIYHNPPQNNHFLPILRQDIVIFACSSIVEQFSDQNFVT
jgi:hypothetical protein